MQELLVTALTGMAARGELQPGTDVAVAARNLVAVLDGLQVQWLLERSFDMTGAARQFINGLLVEPL